LFPSEISYLFAVTRTSFVVLIIVVGYEAPDKPDGYESETFMNVIGNLLLEMEILASCFCPGAIPPP
jgi:hypothetical protein